MTTTVQILNDDERRDLTASIRFWCRDFKKDDDLLKRIVDQINAGISIIDDNTEPVLKDFLEKYVLFRGMNQKFRDGNDLDQREDFRAWVKDTLNQDLSGTFSPYADETHELYWAAYEQAIIEKYYR